MDDATIRKDKQRLRREMRARLASLTPDERTRAGDAASRLTTRATPFSGATTVLLYDALPDEIDTGALIHAAFNAGKRVALPRVDWDRTALHAIEIHAPDWADTASETRRYALREPLPGPEIDPAELDLILVPGLAFDARGNRLGRGRGFYDRFLAALPPGSDPANPKPFRLALAFDFQLVDAVPAGPADQRVHAVATDRALSIC